MQEFKSYVGRRVSAGPEKTFVNMKLGDRALSTMLLHDPCLLKIRQEVRGVVNRDVQKHERCPAAFDGPSLHGGTDHEHMLYRGRKLTPYENVHVKAGLTLLFDERGMPVTDWVSTAVVGGVPSTQERAVMKQMAFDMLDDSGRVFKGAKFKDYNISTMGSGRGKSRANFFIQVGTQHNELHAHVQRHMDICTIHIISFLYNF